MKFTIYMKENNVLVLDNDEYYLVFKFVKDEVIVAKVTQDLLYKPNLKEAKIVFAYSTKKGYNLEEIQKALYFITGKAFSYVLDEDYEPIFSEWRLPVEDLNRHYDALWELFNK